MINIKKLSLSISLLGIIILLILANTLEPSINEIKDISSKDLNKKITTSGTITNIKSFNSYDNFQILTITKESFSIEILLDQKTNLTKNQEIIVSGRVELYKDQPQIRAEKITINP